MITKYKLDDDFIFMDKLRTDISNTLQIQEQTPKQMMKLILDMSNQSMFENNFNTNNDANNNTNDDIDTETENSVASNNSIKSEISDILENHSNLLNLVDEELEEVTQFMAKQQKIKSSIIIDKHDISDTGNKVKTKSAKSAKTTKSTNKMNHNI